MINQSRPCCSGPHKIAGHAQLEVISASPAAATLCVGGALPSVAMLLTSRFIKVARPPVGCRHMDGAGQQQQEAEGLVAVVTRSHEGGPDVLISTKIYAAGICCPSEVRREVRHSTRSSGAGLGRSCAAASARSSSGAVDLLPGGVGLPAKRNTA